MVKSNLMQKGQLWSIFGWKKLFEVSNAPIFMIYVIDFVAQGTLDEVVDLKFELGGWQIFGCEGSIVNKTKVLHGNYPKLYRLIIWSENMKTFGKSLNPQSILAEYLAAKECFFVLFLYSNAWYLTNKQSLTNTIETTFPALCTCMINGSQVNVLTQAYR